MNGECRYFAISAGLHLAATALVLALSSNSVNRRKIMTIDFSLNSRPSSCELKQQKAVPSPPHPVPQASGTGPALVNTAREAITPTELPRIIANEPAVEQPLVGQSVAKLRHEADTPSVSSTAAPPATTAFGNSIQQSAAAIGDIEPAAESGAEHGRKKYLKEHFSYIRDLIVKRLVYPQVARRMEWSGKVILSFVVGEDGGVRSVRVRESSGHPVLDNGAVDTVKKAAPFPPPPVAAEIVMPVHFRLE